MQARSSSPWPRDIERLRRRFETWRGRRERGRRIPEPLWAAAVKLARTHGISVVSRAVHVDYYSLGKRVEAGARSKRARKGASTAATARGTGAGFVELPVPVVAGASPWVMEIEDGRGERLRLEVHGLDVEDLTVLVRSVWSHRR